MTTTGAPRWFGLFAERGMLLASLSGVRDQMEAIEAGTQPDTLLWETGVVDRRVVLAAEAQVYLRRYFEVQAEMQRILGASDSPPGAVGLGLVPPGPNPTEMQEERDEEGFTAAERAESLARAERVFNTLPTAEQVERGKEAARKRTEK